MILARSQRVVQLVSFCAVALRVMSSESKCLGFAVYFRVSERVVHPLLNVIKAVFQDSPLGLILKKWVNLIGEESILSKPKLIQLSEKMWQAYELDNGKTWSKFGSLHRKLISSLIS